MPTRQRISILVTAMRNTHVRGRDEESMFANVRRVYQSEELDSSFSSSSYSCMESRRGRARDRRGRRLLQRITRAVTSPRTTTNKAKGQEIPRGRVGRENADDSTSKCPWELDVRPALSTALTWTVCGPLDRWRVIVVTRPTDSNGPPSMLTSCRAIPEAASEEDQEIVTSDWEMLPLGDGVPTNGGVRSTRIDADFISSSRAASINYCWRTSWPPPTTTNPAALVP